MEWIRVFECNFFKIKLYEYIGKDYQGRPVIIFNCSRVFPDQIADEAKYIDYTFYMLDIFIQDNVEGYIDEFILISDYEPFTSANLRISLANAVANGAKDLFPDRQYKLVCYGFGSFTYTM